MGFLRSLLVDDKGFSAIATFKVILILE